MRKTIAFTLVLFLILFICFEYRVHLVEKRLADDERLISAEGEAIVLLLHIVKQKKDATPTTPESTRL